jgi:hypothetical protein
MRKTTKRYKDKIYTNYLLVETLTTPQGPRQRTICSLGSLSPGPKSKWPGLIGRVEACLQGQASLEKQDPLVADFVTRVLNATSREDIVSVHTDQLRQEKPREAGPVHVGHQMWRRLGLDDILLEGRPFPQGATAHRSHGVKSPGGSVLGTCDAGLGPAHGPE